LLSTTTNRYSLLLRLDFLPRSTHSRDTNLAIQIFTFVFQAKMFNALTSYLFPGTGSVPQVDECVDSNVEIKETEDWVMVTRVPTNQLPHSFCAIDSSDKEVRALEQNEIKGDVLWENLLIEHPSMSVYLHPLNASEDGKPTGAPTEEKNGKLKKKTKKQKYRKDEKQTDSCEFNKPVFDGNKSLKSVVFESKEMVRSRNEQSKRFAKNVTRASEVFPRRSNRMNYLHNSRMNNDRKSCRFISVTSNKRC